MEGKSSSKRKHKSSKSRVPVSNPKDDNNIVHLIHPNKVTRLKAPLRAHYRFLSIARRNPFKPYGLIARRLRPIVWNQDYLDLLGSSESVADAGHSNWPFIDVSNPVWVPPDVSMSDDDLFNSLQEATPPNPLSALRSETPQSPTYPETLMHNIKRKRRVEFRTPEDEREADNKLRNIQHSLERWQAEKEKEKAKRMMVDEEPAARSRKGTSTLPQQRRLAGESPSAAYVYPSDIKLHRAKLHSSTQPGAIIDFNHIGMSLGSAPSLQPNVRKSAEVIDLTSTDFHYKSSSNFSRGRIPIKDNGKQTVEQNQ